MKLPYMNLYPVDYLGDTADFTTIEHGAYFLLILSYWRYGCLPDDEAKLRRITRTSPREWAAIRDVIASKFLDGWKHKRIEAELARCRAKYERRVAAGRRGGIASAASGRRGDVSTPRLAE